MGKISLAEAVKLKSILIKRIYELENELRRVAFTTLEKGESPKEGPRNLKVVDAELSEVRADSRLLDRLIYQANINNSISFEGEDLAIVEAIEYATQLRAQARLYSEFGRAEKEEIQYGYSDTTTVYTLALFDPEEYRLKALELEKRAHKLSNAVNAKNHAIQLDFDDDKYF